MCGGDICALVHLRVASVYGDVTSLDCGVAEMRRGTGERRLPTCAAPALEVDFKGPGRGPGTCLPSPRKALEMERTSEEHNGFVYASLLAAPPKVFFMSRRRPRRVRVIAIADQWHVVKVGGSW